MHPSHSSPVFPDNFQDLPDIFILGFQELDLSAEALLYSTSTLKADAWTSAIFAALGKEADNYIKVCFYSTLRYCCYCCTLSNSGGYMLICTLLENSWYQSNLLASSWLLSYEKKYNLW